MIDAERINSQLSHGKFKIFNLFLLQLKLMQRGSTVSACEKVIASVHEKGIASANEKVIASVDPGRINDWCRGSTVNFHMKNSKDLTYFCCMLVLKLFTLLFTIDTERINSQLSHGKFKRFNLSFLHVGIKTLYITVYNWCREDQQSLHVKRWSFLCMKRWSPLHMKRWLPLLILGNQWSMQRGSTVNFHMKNSKDLTYFFCMLVLKLFTINAKRINSLSMIEGDCLCMWKGDHLCTWKGDHLCTWKSNCLCMWKGDCLCWSWGIDDQHREDQQSTFKWKIQKI